VTSGAPPDSIATLEPDAQVFSQYAGSQACRACHPDAYAAWNLSHHRLAERAPDPALDAMAFDPPRSFQHGTQTTELSMTNGTCVLAARGANGQTSSFAVERVLGHDPLRQFLLRGERGRWQASEAAWDPARQQWFNVYGGEDRQPGEWGHWSGRGMTWNSMCASCHNTRLRKHYDEPTDTFRTTMAEPSVGCEACHGPMRAHSDWQQRYGTTGQSDPTRRPFTRDQVADTCGSCHARRGELSGDFKPGDAFLDHFLLTIVDETDLFHADGQVRDEDYEFAPFLGSKMHAAGVRCVDCHEPHSARTLLPGDLLCLRCHDGSRPNTPIIDPKAHVAPHRARGTPGLDQGVVDVLSTRARHGGEPRAADVGCVDCHMPVTTYMQRHPRHDHGFTVPDPLLTQTHGIPNACNRCHTDRDTAWAVAAAERIYGARLDRPARRRARTVAQVRQGDAAAPGSLTSWLDAGDTDFWTASAAGLLAPWAHEPDTRARLTAFRAHSNALVRAQAVRALGAGANAQLPEIGRVLEQGLVDPVRAVRYHAAWALRSRLDATSPAGRELAQTLALNSDQPIGQLQRAAFASSRGDLAGAVAHFERALQWDPRSAGIRAEYALLLSEAGRPADAVTQLQAACDLAPADAEFRYRLGLGWNELGRLDEAVRALERAVELDPRHARAWYNLGLARSRAGDVEGALQALIRAESIDPSDPRAPYARATVLASAGRFDEARAAASRVLELRPRDPAAAQLLETLRSR
jgi:tetratricopeptide (TPR) repeat protein